MGISGNEVRHYKTTKMEVERVILPPKENLDTKMILSLHRNEIVPMVVQKLANVCQTYF